MAEQEKDRLLLENTREHSKAYAIRLIDLVARYAGTGKREDVQTENTDPAKKPQPRALLTLLKVVPPLLAIGFGISIFWDFPQYRYHLFGEVVQLDGILRTLTVSGLIGYLTNWLAITMLFKPAEKRPLLGQGLVPAQKQRIAEKLAESVSKELINADVIRHKLADQGLIKQYRQRFMEQTGAVLEHPEFRKELKLLLTRYVEDLLGKPEVREIIARKTLDFIEQSVEDRSLEKFAIKVYKSLRGAEAGRMIERAIADLPSKMNANLDQLDQVLDEIPAAVETHADVLDEWAVNAITGLVQALDIKALVLDNLNRYDEQRFEKLIKGSTNEQLNYIQYIGAVLGTIGGLLIWNPLPSLGFMVSAGLLIYGLDRLIGSSAKKKLPSKE
jgi:uncharacterized membrane protein YheB (UPF0754 family)